MCEKFSNFHVLQGVYRKYNENKKHKSKMHPVCKKQKEQDVINSSIERILVTQGRILHLGDFKLESNSWVLRNKN